MPYLTSSLLKLQKPPLSLKQFMLRSEVLKLYRGFMKLGRLIDTPEPQSSTKLCTESSGRNLHPLQLEWINWVRSEFRLRQNTNDEELIRMNLAHGRRQLQEMERTILLANNKNSNAAYKSKTENAKVQKQCSKSVNKSEGT